MNRDTDDIIRERTKHTECVKFDKYIFEFKNEYLCGFLGRSYLYSCIELDECVISYRTIVYKNLNIRKGIDGYILRFSKVFKGKILYYDNFNKLFYFNFIFPKISKQTKKEQWETRKRFMGILTYFKEFNLKNKQLTI